MPPRQTVVVTGAGGQVGREVVDRFRSLSRTEVVGLTHAECDVADYHQVMQRVVPMGPDLIVHTAAWTDVDGCEGDADRAFAHNAMAVRHVRLAAQRVAADLIHLSSDYVFDGWAERPYREWDRPAPLSVYGASKLAGEQEALLWPRTFVVRTSWVVGRGRNFARSIRARAESGGPLRVVDDQRGRLTVAADLATALVALWRSGRYGVWHAANAGEATWFDIAAWVVRRAGLDVDIEPITTHELARPAPRPAFSVLDDTSWRAAGLPPMRSWEEALDEHFEAITGDAADG